MSVRKPTNNHRRKYVRRAKEPVSGADYPKRPPRPITSKDPRSFGEIEIDEKEGHIKNKNSLIYMLPDSNDDVYMDNNRIKILYHPRPGLELVDIFMPYPNASKGQCWLVFCPTDDMYSEENELADDDDMLC